MAVKAEVIDRELGTPYRQDDTQVIESIPKMIHLPAVAHECMKEGRERKPDRHSEEVYY